MCHQPREGEVTNKNDTERKLRHTGARHKLLKVFLD